MYIKEDRKIKLLVELCQEIIEEIRRRDLLKGLAAGGVAAAIPGIASAEDSLSHLHDINSLAIDIIENVLGSYDQYYLTMVKEVLASTHNSRRDDAINEVIIPWLQTVKKTKEAHPYRMPSHIRKMINKELSQRVDKFNSSMQGLDKSFDRKSMSPTKSKTTRKETRSILNKDEKRAYEEARRKGDFEEVTRILNKAKKRLSKQ